MSERIEKCMRMKQISDDDEWWLNICVGKITDKNEKLNDEKISEYVSELDKIYDNKWYREFRGIKKGLGPCPLSIMGGVQDPIFSLIRLGQNLKTLGGVENLENELVKRLKKFETFMDASIEVEISACFKEDGYEVILYPILPSGKKCDVKVKGEEDWICLEIIHFRQSDSDRKSFKLSIYLSDRIHRSISEGFSGEIHFFEVLSPRAKKIIDNIVQKVDEEYAKNGLPIEFKNANVEVKIRKSVGGGTFKIEGLSLFKQKDEGRHLIERTLSKYDQLPEEGPGVIIANPVWLLSPQIGEGMAERVKGLLNLSLHTRVSGIIFSNKRAERSGIIKAIPSVVINPYAKRRCDQDIERLAGALFKYPEWM